MSENLTHIETLNWDVLSDKTLKNKACPWIVFKLEARTIECGGCEANKVVDLEDEQPEIFEHLNEFVGTHKSHNR